MLLLLQGIVVLCCCWCRQSLKCQGSEALQQLSILCTLRGFVFSLLKLDFSWMSINCFHGFLRRWSDRQDSLIILKSRANTYKNFLIMTATVSNYFVDVKDYNAKTMWSLCAKWNSWNTLKVYIQVYRFFIHLIVWRHGRCGQIDKEYKFKETNIITLRTEKIFLGMGAFSRKWIS